MSKCLSVRVPIPISTKISQFDHTFEPMAINTNCMGSSPGDFLCNPSYR